jgi:raffinose/stachyose/melibiose transport system permease protein
MRTARTRGTLDRFYRAALAAPALILFLMFFLLPTIAGFYFSLTDWNQYLPEIRFVGLDNFRQIFSERVSTVALKNTLTFALVTTVGKNLFGLVLALILNRKLRARTMWRAVFFSPAIFSTIIVGLVFSVVLHPKGLLNTGLQTLGLSFLKQKWLTDKDVVMFTVSAVEIWMYTGFHMAIYLAGLQSIPGDFLESARIDGASGWRQFKSIIFPLIIPSFNINLVMALIGGFKVFDMVYVLTNGGPGFASQVVSTMVYKAFGEGRWGYGTAMNLLLFLIIYAVSITVLTFFRKREVEF